MTSRFMPSPQSATAIVATPPSARGWYESTTSIRREPASIAFCTSSRTNAKESVNWWTSSSRMSSSPGPARAVPLTGRRSRRRAGAERRRVGRELQPDLLDAAVEPLAVGPRRGLALEALVALDVLEDARRVDGARERGERAALLLVRHAEEALGLGDVVDVRADAAGDGGDCASREAGR